MKIRRKHRLATARVPGESPNVRRQWKKENRKALRQLGQILLQEGKG